MNTLEAIQVSDSTLVFSQEALQDVIEQGRADPKYLEEIRRQQAADAIAETLQSARDAVVGYVSAIGHNIKLEARMVVFDAFHGTHYRQIRHDLIEQERQKRKEARNRRFAESVGLTAIK